MATAEVDELDNMREAVVGISLVSNDARLNEKKLNRIIDELHGHPDVVLENQIIEATRL